MSLIKVDMMETGHSGSETNVGRSDKEGSENEAETKRKKQVLERRTRAIWVDSKGLRPQNLPNIQRRAWRHGWIERLNMDPEEFAVRIRRLATTRRHYYHQTIRVWKNQREATPEVDETFCMFRKIVYGKYTIPCYKDSVEKTTEIN